MFFLAFSHRYVSSPTLSSQHPSDLPVWLCRRLHYISSAETHQSAVFSYLILWRGSTVGFLSAHLLFWQLFASRLSHSVSRAGPQPTSLLDTWLLREGFSLQGGSLIADWAVDSDTGFLQVASCSPPVTCAMLVLTKCTSARPKGCQPHEVPVACKAQTKSINEGACSSLTAGVFHF